MNRYLDNISLILADVGPARPGVVCFEQGVKGGPRQVVAPPVQVSHALGVHQHSVPLRMLQETQWQLRHYGLGACSSMQYLSEDLGG